MRVKLSPLMLLLVFVSACTLVSIPGISPTAAQSTPSPSADVTATPAPPDGTPVPVGPQRPVWTQLSTTTGDLAVPSESTQQTAALVLDVDGDGVNDFVIGAREAGPALVWYQRGSTEWTRHVIEPATLPIEAGGAAADIDGDGDLDIVMGGDYSSSQVWWWENPAPNFDPNTGWTRRLIKDSGERQHHDQIFADIDGDGALELVFWNQREPALLWADIPADPRATQPWPFATLFAGAGEGLDVADMDGDGLLDVLAGGRWFKRTADGTFTPNVIDDSMREARIAAGDLIPGGNLEIVMVIGDATGPLRWYSCEGDPADSGCWVGHDLLDREVFHGHSLALADVDRNGELDIFVAEMRLDGENEQAGMWLFLGDGTGTFERTDIATGIGNHESRLADLDGDGDLDILGKPYNWQTPRLDIWINNPESGGGNDGPLALDQWVRHTVDTDKPWRGVFILAGDLNGDGLPDLTTGGWWYPNPGAPDGAWARMAIGDPLFNVAALADFDGDGDLDILGTQGRVESDRFAWAENDGAGSFTVHTNVGDARGDFLQGVAVGHFQNDALAVMLAWHAADLGVQSLTVPVDPVNTPWPWAEEAAVSQDEALSAGDIDGDGDLDLLLGTVWLRNEGDSWTPFTLFEDPGAPDRNRLVDINGDGRLDALVGYETISEPGKLAWYEQGMDPTALWSEHVIAADVVGPMSLDAADLDRDGDLDVVVGEHNLEDPASARLLVYENLHANGLDWQRVVVYTGDEHHDGALLVDIDNDGDLDMASIGWGHGNILLYENRAINPDSGNGPTPTPTPEPGRTTAGLQLFYGVEAGDGAIVPDEGAMYGLDLTIQDPAAVRWVPGGLAVESSTSLLATGDLAALMSALQASNALTVEAWLQPAEAIQSGPARIVTFSADLLNRNFTLGQGRANGRPGAVYDMRLRTTATTQNGVPSLSSPLDTATTQLTHVVYTRAADGTAALYVNNELVSTGTVAGTFETWAPEYSFLLANEATGTRPWLGTFYLVALYDRALSPAEVLRNYAAGADALPTNPPEPAVTPTTDPAATPPAVDPAVDPAVSPAG